MDDSRTDAPKFDLTAQPSEDEDVLLAEPADLSSATADTTPQKKKPEVKPTPPNAEFDAKLFNALVSPVAPVHLTERSASAQQPAPVKPIEAPAPHVAAPPESEIVEPASDAFIDGPLRMVQPAEQCEAPSVHDWEPLPPLMRLVSATIDDRPRTQDEPESAEVGDYVAPHVEAEPEAEPERVTVVSTWDPAAIEDPPALTDAPAMLTGTVPDASIAVTPGPSEWTVPEEKSRDTVVAPAETDPAELEPPTPAKARVHEPMPEFAPLLEASPEDLDASLSPVVPAPVTPVEKPGRTGAWWTLPLMCIGLAIVACAVLVPAADENRRHLHELAKLQQDVAYFQKQSEVNQQFLEHVSTDPTLAERLAQRQLRMTRAESRVVEMPRERGPFSMSPYALVTIDPPAPMPEYRPMGGFLSRYFLDTKGQIYLTGLGILLVAAGVILGGGEPRKTSVE